MLYLMDIPGCVIIQYIYVFNYHTVALGVGKLGVKFLLHTCEDLNLNPQYPCSKQQ